MSKLPIIPRARRSTNIDEVGEITYTAFPMGINELLLESALDTTDTKSMLDTIEQVMESVLQPGVDVKSLPYHVIEFLFVKSRALSMGSSIPVNYTCENIVGGETCGNTMEAVIDLDEVHIHRDEDFTDIIELGGGWSMKMRYATIKTTQEASEIASREKQSITDIVSFYMESVFNEDGEVIERDSLSDEDLHNWLVELGVDVHMRIVERFYSKLPYILFEHEVKCSECGKVHKVEHRGLNQLFM